MQEFLDQLNTLVDGTEMDHQKLEQFLSQIDWDKIDFSNFYPPLEENIYGKNCTQAEPIEVDVICWGPEVASGIHRHNQFWGFIVVLEGEIHNTFYAFNGKQLREGKRQRVSKGDFAMLPFDVIHRMGNDKSEPAITLHIYYPPQPHLGGSEIFSEEGRLGVLKDTAERASFNQDDSNFSSIQENAFDYIPYSSES